MGLPAISQAWARSPALIRSHPSLAAILDRRGDGIAQRSRVTRLKDPVGVPIDRAVLAPAPAGRDRVDHLRQVRLRSISALNGSAQMGGRRVAAALDLQRAARARSRVDHGELCRRAGPCRRPCRTRWRPPSRLAPWRYRCRRAARLLQPAESSSLSAAGGRGSRRRGVSCR